MENTSFPLIFIEVSPSKITSDSVVEVSATVSDDFLFSGSPLLVLFWAYSEVRPPPYFGPSCER